MNLGITLSTPPSRTVSITDVYSAYIDMQAATDEMNDDLHQISALSETMSNIRDIARTIKAHHSSEALAAIQNLFEDKNVTSFETLKEKARAVWNKIMSLFNAIGEKMRAAYTKYRSKYLQLLKERGNKAIVEMKSFNEQDYDFTIQYRGINLTDQGCNEITDKALKIILPDANVVTPFSEAKPKLANLLNVGQWTVTGKDKVIGVVEKAVRLAGKADRLYTETWSDYYKAREKMRKAYSDDDVEKAKKYLDDETECLKGYLFVTKHFFWTATAILSHSIKHEK